MIDSIQLQSVVDGECTNAQRQAVLNECDSDPKQWKSLALALLEEQLFRKQIAIFGTKNANEKCANDNRESRDHSLIENADVIPCPSFNLKLPSGLGNAGVAGGITSRPSNWTRWSSWGPVLAAGFLAVMGFVGGRTYFGVTSEASKNDGQETIAQTQKTGHQDSTIGLVADTDPYDGMPETDLRVRLPSSDYEIPIFDASDFDPTIALAKQEIEIEEANQRLRKQGFEIDMKPEYVMGKLQDGRQVIVPVHKVGLRQYGQ